MYRSLMCTYLSLLNEKMAITTYANTKHSDQPANLHNVIRECACLSESLRFATVTQESCISRYLPTDRGDRGSLIGQYHYFGEIPKSNETFDTHKLQYKKYPGKTF